jgi:hypothetical protein
VPRDHRRAAARTNNDRGAHADDIIAQPHR